MVDPESYKTGYRQGYEAGRIAQMQAQERLSASLAAVGKIRKPRVTGPKCEVCGHANSSHNDLGYCQARGKKYSDGCHCDGMRM